jgi:hypothetical protein
MKPFNLLEYLENPSRKVVTRLKKSVQIISIEGKEDIPIVALVEGVAHQYKPNGYHADVVVAYSNQCRDMGDYDLFFAEEELTEFEKEILNLLNCATPEGHGSPTIEKTKEYSQKLIDLARKEILKDLPKWKKATEHKDLEKHVAILEEDKVLLSNYLEEGDYYIKLEDLKSLPKEG